jgi:hypothetical protein
VSIPKGPPNISFSGNASQLAVVINNQDRAQTTGIEGQHGVTQRGLLRNSQLGKQ